jgi:hypothetical protein
MPLPNTLQYQAIKKLRVLSSFRPISNSHACITWPPLRTNDEIRWLSRWLAWYLPPQTQIGITVPIKEDSFSLAETIHPQAFATNVTLTKWPMTSRRFDSVLLHRAAVAEAIRALWLFKGQLQIIDKEFWDVEESLAFENIFRVHQTQKLRALREQLEKVSLRNYTQLFQMYEGSERAFVFATGPSLRRALETGFQGDELTIGCNSIVKDRELLAHIRPKILTFADQAFHFGPSDYAAAFRRDALRVLQDYRCKCIVPVDRAILLALHYPEVVDHVIAMPFGSTLNFPTPARFFVQATENIMTLFMVPVASALAKQVCFCGADGRTPGEHYFWRYDSQAQYQSLLQNVTEWHPSFFRDRHIDMYYKQHCETLERQLRYGESRGIRYVALTPSQIPALAQRYREEEQRMGSSLN